MLSLNAPQTTHSKSIGGNIHHIKDRETAGKREKHQPKNNVLIFVAQGNTILLTGVACDVISGSFILTSAVPWGLQNCLKTLHWRQMPLFKTSFGKVHFPAAVCPSRVDKACVHFFCHGTERLVARWGSWEYKALTKWDRGKLLLSWSRCIHLRIHSVATWPRLSLLSLLSYERHAFYVWKNTFILVGCLFKALKSHCRK